MDCNFDFGLCNGWKNNPMNDPELFDWTLHYGPTTTADTGEDCKLLINEFKISFYLIKGTLK